MAEPRIPDQKPKSAEAPKPQPDPYTLFIENSPMLSVEDIAIYSQKDGKLIVPVDARNRPLLNCTIYFRKELWDKMMAIEKPK